MFLANMRMIAMCMDLHYKLNSDLIIFQERYFIQKTLNSYIIYLKDHMLSNYVFIKDWTDIYYLKW